jgi:hypothetical protein
MTQSLSRLGLHKKIAFLDSMKYIELENAFLLSVPEA